MVSRAEIVGVALLGIALLSKGFGNREDPFILSESNFLRQGPTQANILDTLALQKEDEFQIALAPLEAQRGPLIAERKGVLGGLNNLITGFFSKFFTFRLSEGGGAEIFRFNKTKFRVSGGFGNIFGVKIGPEGPIESPRSIAVSKTINFGQTRLIDLSQQIGDINQQILDLNQSFGRNSAGNFDSL